MTTLLIAALLASEPTIVLTLAHPAVCLTDPFAAEPRQAPPLARGTRVSFLEWDQYRTRLHVQAGPRECWINPYWISVEELQAAGIVDDAYVTLRTRKVQDMRPPERRGSPSPTGSSPASLDPRAAVPTIKRHCADRWPDDFSMQVHCREEQAEAVKALESREMSIGQRATARRHCAERWPDDYAMRDHCEREQLEALARLE